MTQNQDDKLQINKIRKGDILSFDNIFKKYHKKVYYFALSYLKNKEEAEDVVQEVFMNLWKCRDQINEYYVFSRYLFKITYNATCKKFRKMASDKSQVAEILKTIITEDNSTNIDIEYKSLLETANIIIEKMPSRQKEIFLLSLNDNLNSEQIAMQLNISKKTVENYIGMARTSLKNLLYDNRLITLLFFWLFFK